MAAGLLSRCVIAPDVEATIPGLLFDSSDRLYRNCGAIDFSGYFCLRSRQIVLPESDEDLVEGETFPLSDVVVTADEIIEFAQQFDPQPMQVRDGPVTGKTEGEVRSAASGEA